jgi:hypothetical protein
MSIHCGRLVQRSALIGHGAGRPDRDLSYRHMHGGESGLGRMENGDLGGRWYLRAEETSVIVRMELGID